MARIFITGSSDGLGQLTAAQLISQGHQIILHARNDKRAKEAMAKTPGAESVVNADLSSIQQTIELADGVNALGGCDVVIHNAGIYRASEKEIFTVNVLAPYILTCLMNMPKRLIYLSSGMHRGGSPLMEVTDQNRTSYSDSKLQVTTLMKAVSRLYPQVFSNAVDPGWVPTKMGGSSAPDSLEKGYQTQAWLAISNEPGALVSGAYFYHLHPQSPHSAVNDISLQDRLLNVCKEITGVPFPPSL